MRVLVLHRIVPPAATPKLRLPARDARARAPPAAPRARRHPGDVRALRLAAARPRATGAGDAGRRRRCGARCGACGRDFAFDLRPRPQRRARRRRRAARRRRRRRSSSPSTAPTSSTPRCRHADGRAAIERAFGAARLVLANSDGHRARRARPRRARARASCTSGPTCRPRPAHGARPDDARHGRATSSRASATRTSCARCGCCASATRTCATSSSATGPSARRWSALARELGPGGPRRRSPASSSTRRRSSARARCHAVRDAERRRGVRRRLRRGDGRLACRRSARSASPGPAEIARAGDGIRLVPPGDVELLAAAIDALVERPGAPARPRAPRARDRRGGVHLGGLRPRDGRRLRGGAARMSGRPVLLVTNLVPAGPRPVAARAARARGARGRDLRRAPHHATAGVDDPGVPFVRVSQRGVHALAASGRYRAVIATSAGRVALPAAFFGARRAGVPFLYWTGIWHQVAHARAPARDPARCATSSARPTRRSPTASTSPPTRARTARATCVVAPHAVDGAFWGADRRRGGRRGGARAATGGDPAAFLALYAGRATPGKGVDVLLDAWRPGWAAGRGARARRDRAPRTCRGGAVARRRHRARPARPRRSCATSTRPRTLWSCHRCPREPSASRGRWWSTKPCPGARPSSPPTPSAPPPAASCATARPGLVVPAGRPGGARRGDRRACARTRGLRGAPGRGGRRGDRRVHAAGLGGRGLRCTGECGVRARRAASVGRRAAPSSRARAAAGVPGHAGGRASPATRNC